MKTVILATLLSVATPLLAAPFVSSINREPQTTLVVSGNSTVFRVTFNTSVTGVDVSDFTLVTIGTVTGTIASVTGSGTTYDVTVNSIAGFGQLRLDLKGSGTGIVDGGSVGITEGFNNGQTITFGTSAPVGWGNNGAGQLGDGTTTSPRSIPVATTVTGLLNGKTIASMASGSAHTLLLTADNRLYAWGQGSAGQLGDGTGNFLASSTPVAVSMTGVLSGKTIVAVACGGIHSLALDSTGKLYAWGQNAIGQLGDGTGVSGVKSDVPVAVLTSGVLSGKVITGMAGGSSFTIVCTSDGGVYTWGQGTNGQLGNGTTTTTNSPGAVDTSGVLSGKRIVAVAAGGNFAAVLSSDGRVYTWGSNNQGQIGDGLSIGTVATYSSPVAVSGNGLPGGKKIANLYCGNQVVYALATDGTLYAWGNNINGALGVGNNTSSSTPLVVPMTGVLSGKTITTLGAGNGYAYALTSEGKVYSWGINSFNQLGDGSNPATVIDRNSPVAVDVSAGSALNGKTVGFVSSGSQGVFGMVGINAAVAPVTTAPTVSTDTQSAVTHNSATLGGNVTADGGASVTDRGIVWGTSSNPTTIADTKVANGSGTGAFSATVNGLPSNTLIHVRAYATNSVNTSYGNDISFNTLPAPVAVTSLNTANASPTNASFVNWTLTFASPVTGLTASNFSLTGAAAAGSGVVSPGTSNGGLTWTIPVSTGSTDGTLTLNLANATGLSAAISNTLPFTGQSYTIDKTPPTVLSVTRLTPTGQSTNLTTVTFRVTYSEPVTLNAPATSRFQVVPVNGSTIVGTVTGVTGSGNTRDVTVNLTSGVGEFKLRVID